MNEYNTERAVEAQREYCARRGFRLCAPEGDARCPRCGRDIYAPVVRERGNVTGIDVELAGECLVTCCPHCLRSFAGREAKQ